MHPLPRKIAVIMDFPEPQDETELKRFLAMCQQFRKFFPDLSHVGKPLKEQLKKSNDFIFGPVEKKHFEYVKEAINTKMKLIAYDPKKKTRVYYDACENGLAYLIMQLDEEAEFKCKGEGEKNFCKAIGHHYALTKGQFYLKGTRSPFQAVTDNFALRRSDREASRRPSRQA